MTETIDLEPQTLDLVLYAGDGFSLRLTIVDPSDAPMDLSGSIDAQIRAERSAADPPKAIFSVDSTDADSGIVILSLTGEQTSDLTKYFKDFEGVWDVQWTPIGKEPTTLMQGNARCVLDVTR